MFDKAPSQADPTHHMHSSDAESDNCHDLYLRNKQQNLVQLPFKDSIHHLFPHFETRTAHDQISHLFLSTAAHTDGDTLVRCTSSLGFHDQANIHSALLQCMNIRIFAEYTSRIAQTHLHGIKRTK
jgi:hypothetical protein